jgi:hypothetical protein
MAPAPINHLERLDDGVMELLASLLGRPERAAMSECSRWGLATLGDRLLDRGRLKLSWPRAVARQGSIHDSRTPGQTLAGLLRRHPQARVLSISDLDDEVWEAVGEALRVQPCPAVEELSISWDGRGRTRIAVQGGIELGSTLAGPALPALKELVFWGPCLEPEAASWVFEPLSNPDNCPALECLVMDMDSKCYEAAVAVTSALRRRSENGGRGLKQIAIHPAGPGAVEFFSKGGAALTTLEDVALSWSDDADAYCPAVIQALGGFMAGSKAPALVRLSAQVPSTDWSLAPVFNALGAGAAPRLRYLMIENLCNESVLELAAAFEAGALRQLAELELRHPGFDKRDMTRLVEGVLRSPDRGAALETLTMNEAQKGEEMAEAGMIFFEGLERGAFPRLGALSIYTDYGGGDTDPEDLGSFTDARAIRRFIRALEWGAPCASTLTKVSALLWGPGGGGCARPGAYRTLSQGEAGVMGIMLAPLMLCKGCGACVLESNRTRSV